MDLDMALAPDPRDSGDPGVRAERINLAFRNAGYTREFIDFWWNQLASRDLGGRTPAAAWSANNDEPVESRASARLAHEPDIRAWIEETDAKISDGSIWDEIEAQSSPGEMVDRWGAEHPTQERPGPPPHTP